MKNLRRLSLRIYGLQGFPQLLQDTARFADSSPNSSRGGYWQWYLYLAVDLLRGHGGLEVAFVANESKCYAAAKRVKGYIVTTCGSLERFSRHQFPNGLLDEDDVFPAQMPTLCKYPPGKVVHLEDLE